jgi:hypothetical protein
MYPNADLRIVAEFFATTRFFIDRYHQFNHVSCSKAHSMAGYEELKSYNSQSAE